jgi:pantetheine-phosphate adenylyltransferase
MKVKRSPELSIGLYPASFDPITIAHVSIAERAARLLDHLYVAIAVNPGKKYLFELDKKIELVQESIGHIANAEVISLEEGLTVDHARRLGAKTMIRGARSVTDFLDEIDLYGQNLYVQDAIGIRPANQTFVDTQTYYALPGQDHISSSLVRGLMGMPGVEDRTARIKPLVPEPVFEVIIAHLDNDQ